MPFKHKHITLTKIFSLAKRLKTHFSFLQHCAKQRSVNMMKMKQCGFTVSFESVHGGSSLQCSFSETSTSEVSSYLLLCTHSSTWNIYFQQKLWPSCSGQTLTCEREEKMTFSSWRRVLHRRYTTHLFGFRVLVWICCRYLHIGQHRVMFVWTNQYQYWKSGLCLDIHFVSDFLMHQVMCNLAFISFRKWTDDQITNQTITVIHLVK